MQLCRNVPECRDFRVLGISVTEEALDAAAAALGLPEVKHLSEPAPHLLHCRTGPLGELQDALRGLGRRLESDTGAETLGEARRILDDEIPALVVSALADGRVAEQPSPSHERQRALDRALACIRSQPKRPLGVAELCRRVSCNERTLRRAFLERFSLSTRDYLRAIRLNGTFRALCAADPATTQISTIARDWGFGHLGEFAGHYRNLFGESPSQTLQRARSTNARSVLIPRG